MAKPGSAFSLISLLRRSAPVLFVALVAVSVLFGRETGWSVGTLSGFGIASIAAICPLGSLETMLARGEMVPRIALAFLGFLGAVFVFGRFFCGWLCPVPGLSKLKALLRRRDSAQALTANADRADAQRAFFSSDARSADTQSAALASSMAQPASASASSAPSCSSAASCSTRRVIPIQPANAPTAPRGKTAYAPYAVLGTALVSSFLFGFPVFCLVCPVGLTFAAVIALAGFFTTGSIPGSAFIFAAILAAEILFLRRWCSSFCPIGALMTLMSRINFFFRPHVRAQSCLKKGWKLDCRICQEACPEGIDLTAEPTAAELARCTRCRACADACPTHSITFPSIPMEKDDRASHTLALRTDIPLRPAAERLGDFSEVHGLLSREAALAESARCIGCGACTRACPQGNPIPEWMAMMREGRFTRAGEKMLAAGHLPELCSRLCPQERLCEGVCPLAASGGPVAVGALVRYASEECLSAGWRPHPIRRLAAKKHAAVVGAGPAGLACAEALAMRGAAVTVFDRAPEAGGLLTQAIPAFKLDPAAVLRRKAMLEAMGVTFRLGTEVGRDISGEEILGRYDAVFAACGAPVAAELEVPGADAQGVFTALEFLSTVRKNGTELRTLTDRFVRGRTVVVIGGGASAIDCLRTALRLGASRAVSIVRRDAAHLRAPEADAKLAREEGAEMRFEETVTRVLTDEAGNVTGVLIHSPAREEDITLSCSAVIAAIGERCVRPQWLEAAGVAFDADNRIIVTGTHTANPKIFAGGDAVRGPSLVTEAAADGRAAARAMAAQLGLIAVPAPRKIRRL